MRTFLIVTRSVLRMRNFSDKFVMRIKTPTLYAVTFFSSKILLLMK